MVTNLHEQKLRKKLKTTLSMSVFSVKDRFLWADWLIYEITWSLSKPKKCHYFYNFSRKALYSWDTPYQILTQNWIILSNWENLHRSSRNDVVAAQGLYLRGLTLERKRLQRLSLPLICKWPLLNIEKKHQVHIKGANVFIKKHWKKLTK